MRGGEPTAGSQSIEEKGGKVGRCVSLQFSFDRSTRRGSTTGSLPKFLKILKLPPDV